MKLYICLITLHISSFGAVAECLLIRKAYITPNNDVERSETIVSERAALAKIGPIGLEEGLSEPALYRAISEENWVTEQLNVQGKLYQRPYRQGAWTAIEYHMNKTAQPIFLDIETNVYHAADTRLTKLDIVLHGTGGQRIDASFIVEQKSGLVVAQTNYIDGCIVEITHTERITCPDCLLTELSTLTQSDSNSASNYLFELSEIGGIGMLIALRDGAIRVVHVQNNSPAMRAGITKGWIVESVDGINVSGMSLGQVSTRIRGPIRSYVNLGFLQEDGSRKTIQIERAKMMPYEMGSPGSAGAPEGSGLNGK